METNTPDEKAGILCHVGKKGKHLEVYPEDWKRLATWDNAMGTGDEDGYRLPTRKEMHRIVKSGLVALADDWYWTSEEGSGGYFEEIDDDLAMAHHPRLGTVPHLKSNLLHVRAVRTFKEAEK